MGVRRKGGRFGPQGRSNFTPKTRITTPGSKAREGNFGWEDLGHQAPDGTTVTQWVTDDTCSATPARLGCFLRRAMVHKCASGDCSCGEAAIDLNGYFMQYE